MDLILVAAALLSAILHAGWNAAVKASPDPQATMTAQSVLAAALAVAGLAVTGLPAPRAWGWIAVSSVLYLLTVTALLRAYEAAGFGVAYPVARALSTMLVVPLSALLAGDTLSGFGLVGVACIVAALVLLALSNAGDTRLPASAAGWIALSGMATAANVMCDAHVVRLTGSALDYGFAVSIANAIILAWWQNLFRAPWREIAGHFRFAAPIALASTTSFLLILWVYQRAPIAPSAALRDTSAVFAVLIAVIWLKERLTRWRLAAVLLAAAAVPLLRLA